MKATLPVSGLTSTRILHGIMATVCIIGAGDIGGASAHALARGERVARAAGGRRRQGRGRQGVGHPQSGAVDRFSRPSRRDDDVSRVAGCAVCVVADRFGRPAAEWQGEEGLAMLRRGLRMQAMRRSCLRAHYRTDCCTRSRARGTSDASAPRARHPRRSLPRASDGRDGSELFAVGGRAHRARNASIRICRAVERGIDWRIQSRARAIPGS